MAKDEKAAAVAAPTVEKTAAPAEKASAPAVVRLTHGEAKAPYVSTVVLEPGLSVAYRDGEPVTYDGDPGKFVNAFAAQCHPARVKIDENNLGTRNTVIDGHTVEVPVVQRTLRLMDG